MDSIDLETVPGRCAAFSEFLRRHAALDPSGEFAQLVDRVGRIGSAEVESAAYGKTRAAIRPLHNIAVVSWNALESAQRRATDEARARHARLGWEFDESKLAFDWHEGERAYRLSVNLSGAIDAAREVQSKKARAHLQASALVHARELLRVMSDAFTPPRKPQETDTTYDIRTSAHLFAGTSALREHFNFAWVHGQPEVSLRIVRDTLSHGDALVTDDGLVVYRRGQKDTQLVSNKDLENYLNLALATYDVAAMDTVRVIANQQAHLDRHVRPWLRPWEDFVNPA